MSKVYMTKDFARIIFAILRISAITSTIFLTSGNSRKGSEKFTAPVPLLPNNLLHTNSQ